MSHWYLFDDAGLHRGPLSTDSLVRAIQAGDVAKDTPVATETWFEPLGGSGWRPAHTVPEIAKLIEIEEAKKARKLRIIPGAFTIDRRGTLDFGRAVMMMPTEQSSPPSKAGAPCVSSENGDES